LIFVCAQNKTYLYVKIK